MKHYPKNSPEAVARVVAMMMIADSRLDDRELGIMDELRIYDIIGISRNRFSQVMQDYCSDLVSTGDANGHIRLVDENRINEIVDLLDDHDTRVRTCSMMLNIAKADGKLHATEVAVFRHILDRWGFTLDSLERELSV
jgi:Tellurite resistance protein TerB